MKRILFVLAIVLAVAIPVQAITFGEPDGNRHPNVGAMALVDAEGGIQQICSGTLIAPNVFLTASHCTVYLQAIGVVPHDVWVSFDPVLDENATLTRGTYDVNPNYGHDMADLHDVAVVILDEVPAGIAPAQLPPVGLLNEMKREGTLKDQTFIAVGYGTVRDDKTGGPHGFIENDERRFAEQSFIALKPAWLQLSMNPSTGDGGTCYGDSGGPHFLGDTDIIVSVTVTGDAMCRATDVTYRLDTESARSYLSQFAELP